MSVYELMDLVCGTICGVASAWAFTYLLMQWLRKRCRLGHDYVVAGYRMDFYSGKWVMFWHCENCGKLEPRQFKRG